MTRVAIETPRCAPAVGPLHPKRVAVAGNQGDRAPEAERSATVGICQQCGEPFRGRQDKRFCRDACRTRFGRERKAKEVQVTIARLTRLAGVVG